jgi:pilus assembly protein CpaB
VRQVPFPTDALPEGAFATLDAVFPKGEAVLRKAMRAIEKDEALLAVKVTEPGQDAGVSSRLSKGMRAFAIRVDVSRACLDFCAPATGSMSIGPGSCRVSGVARSLS